MVTDKFGYLVLLLHSESISLSDLAHYVFDDADIFSIRDSILPIVRSHHSVIVSLVLLPDLPILHISHFLSVFHCQVFFKDNFEAVVILGCTPVPSELPRLLGGLLAYVVLCSDLVVWLHRIQNDRVVYLKQTAELRVALFLLGRKRNLNKRFWRLKLLLD